MVNQFLRNPSSVVLLASLAAAILALLNAPQMLRLPLGLLAVLVLPGHSLTVALLPGENDLDWIERLALSLALSFTIVSVLALALDATPWGLTYLSLTISVTAWTALVSAIAWARLHNGTRSDGPSIFPKLAALSSSDRSVKLIFATLAGAVALSAVVLTLMLNTKPPPLTEFYLLGPDGLAENYPRSARPGEDISVIAVVANRGETAATYEIIVESRTHILTRLGPISLLPGEVWKEKIAFPILNQGKDQEINFELLKPGQTESYRSLRLWIDLTDEASS